MSETYIVHVTLKNINNVWFCSLLPKYMSFFVWNVEEFLSVWRKFYTIQGNFVFDHKRNVISTKVLKMTYFAVSFKNNKINLSFYVLIICSTSENMWGTLLFHYSKLFMKKQKDSFINYIKLGIHQPFLVVVVVGKIWLLYLKNPTSWYKKWNVRLPFVPATSFSKKA